MKSLEEIRNRVENRPLIEDGDFISLEAFELIESMPHWRRALLFAGRCKDRQKYTVEMRCLGCGKQAITRQLGMSHLIKATYRLPLNRARFLCRECLKQS